MEKLVELMEQKDTDGILKVFYPVVRDTTNGLQEKTSELISFMGDQVISWEPYTWMQNEQYINGVKANLREMFFYLHTDSGLYRCGIRDIPEDTNQGVSAGIYSIQAFLRYSLTRPRILMKCKCMMPSACAVREVLRRGLVIPADRSYITVEPGQTAESYTAGLRQKYITALVLAGGYVILYAAVWCVLTLVKKQREVRRYGETEKTIPKGSCACPVAFAAAWFAGRLWGQTAGGCVRCGRAGKYIHAPGE